MRDIVSCLQYHRWVHGCGEEEIPSPPPSLSHLFPLFPLLKRFIGTIERLAVLYTLRPFFKSLGILCVNIGVTTFVKVGGTQQGGAQEVYIYIYI